MEMYCSGICTGLKENNTTNILTRLNRYCIHLSLGKVGMTGDCGLCLKKRTSDTRKVWDNTYHAN